MILASILQSIKRDVVRPIIGNAITKVQRYFRRNKGDDDYATIPEVTLTGDFVIEFDMHLDGFLSAAFGNTSGTGFLRFTSATSVRFNPDITLVDFSVSAIDLNQFYGGVRLSRVSGVCKLLIEGIEYIGSNTSSETFVINRLYQKGDGFYYDGILANLKIWDNGTLIRDYPLDESKGTNVIVNRATELGADLVSDSQTWLPQNSTITGNSTSTIVCTTTNGDGGFYFDLPTTVGKEYLLRSTVDDPDHTLRVYDRASFSTRIASDPYEVVFTALSSVCRIYLRNEGYRTVSYSNVMINEADGYGAIVNGDDEDKGLFTKQANGDWLGKELIVNGGFDTDLSGWVVTEPAGQTAEWDNGRLHIITTDGTGVGVRQVPFVVGLNYRLTLDYEAVSGDLKYTMGSSDFPISTTKSVVTNQVIAASGNLFLYRNVGAGEGYFDNVSVKELLKSA